MLKDVDDHDARTDTQGNEDGEHHVVRYQLNNQYIRCGYHTGSGRYLRYQPRRINTQRYLYARYGTVRTTEYDGCVAAGVGTAFGRVCLFVCLSLYLSVCLFVRALKGKRLELSTPNFVHVYPTAVARHAVTQRSKRQRSRSHGYENRHGRPVASDARTCCYGRLLLMPAWVCMSIRLPMFSSYIRCGNTFMMPMNLSTNISLTPESRCRICRLF